MGMGMGARRVYMLLLLLLVNIPPPHLRCFIVRVACVCAFWSCGFGFLGIRHRNPTRRRKKDDGCAGWLLAAGTRKRVYFVICGVEVEGYAVGYTSRNKPFR